MSDGAYRPYAGLKVADFSQGLAGPYCAMQLAAYGADVIKVEPLAGDWCRPLGTAAGSLSATFVAVNQGKRSIAVDFTADAGRALARDIAVAGDIVVQSFRPGVMDRMGLGYDSLRAAAPGLIYVSISGYGQTGDRRHLPATDTILQGVTGMAANNADGGGTPKKVYITPIDYAAGQYAAHATGAALFERTKTGAGRHVDVSLLATAAAMQGARMAEHRLTGGAPPAELFSPLGIFEAADGHITISTVKERHFAELCEKIGAPDLAADPRFRSHPERMAHFDEMVASLNHAFRRQPVAHWVEVLTSGGMMCGPVQDYGAFLAAELAADQPTLAMVAQGQLGDVPVPAIPGVADGAALGPAPRLGEHSAAILAEIGCDGVPLIDEGVVAEAA